MTCLETPLGLPISLCGSVAEWCNRKIYAKLVRLLYSYAVQVPLQNLRRVGSQQQFLLSEEKNPPKPLPLLFTGKCKD